MTLIGPIRKRCEKYLEEGKIMDEQRRWFEIPWIPNGLKYLPPDEDGGYKFTKFGRIITILEIWINRILLGLEIRKLKLLKAYCEFRAGLSLLMGGW